MDRRRALMGTAKRKLPTGYQEVDYILNTAGAYIDLERTAKTTDKVIVHAKLKETGKDVPRYLFGYSSGNRYMIAVANASDSYIVDLLSSTYRITSNISGYDGMYHVHRIENKEYFIDDISRGASSARAAESGTLWLFGANGSTLNSIWEIKRFELVKDGVKTMELIPAVRVSDNAVGMYDLCGTVCPLTGTPFYVNAGSGSFTAGPTVN